MNCRLRSTARGNWLDARQLEVQVEILSGFHINANPTAAGLIATQVVIPRDAVGQVADVEYPPGEEQQFAFSEAPMRVYSNQVSVLVRFGESMAGQPTPPNRITPGQQGR